MLDFLGVGSDQVMEALWETLQMLVISGVIGAVIALALALLLILTRQGGLMENKVIFTLIDTVTNIVRSIPFIILLVYIGPLTRAIVGTRIGTRAAIVPLVFYIVPMMIRLFENSFLDVDVGIIEAAQAMGAANIQIIRYFLFPESLGSIVLSATTAIVGLLGATAMAGAIGGGGIGDLAITYGYRRFNRPLMTFAVIVLIIFVQIMQTIGNRLSDKIRNH